MRDNLGLRLVIRPYSGTNFVNHEPCFGQSFLGTSLVPSIRRPLAYLSTSMSSVFSIAGPVDLEARWAELMMPVDLETEPSTVCPRDLKERSSMAQDATASSVPPRTM